MPFSFSPIIILPVRVIQALFALIVLITLAYAANKWSDWTWSPSEINFLIFAAVWTLLALVYLVLAPMRYERYAHKYGILATEAITMIFWFAGFIALANLLNDFEGGCGKWGPCSAAIAGDVFAAFEWLLFAFTTFLAAHHVYESRDGGTSKHDPNIEIQPQHQHHSGNIV